VPDGEREALRAKLGRITATLPDGYDVTAGTSGAVVILKYRTTFERGEGLETFEFRVCGRDASLLAYTVNSPTLVVD
jgi:hypothetical protein